MPKISRDTAANHTDHGPVEEWSEDVADYTANFVHFNIDLDAAPFLKGLPNDECSCPHWGYVIKGRAIFTLQGREEVIDAGEAFYVPAGHLSRVTAGTELVQFSPAAALRVVDEVMKRNMAQMQPAEA